MKSLLWIGDAGCPSGFARCTHEILETLRHSWDVTVIGLNYRGDPHPYPYPIFPAGAEGDPWGFGRIARVMHAKAPDLIVVQNDSWNFPAYVKRIRGAEAGLNLARTPIVGIVAVDGTNCDGSKLNDLDLAIFWTHFGQQEARLGGHTGPSIVIPLGVDTDVFKPESREEAREALGLPEIMREAFIIGNVNRNQPRKRLDLLVMYFAEWIKTQEIDDAFLFLHIAPTGDVGFDCAGLARYHGTHNRLVEYQPEVFYGAPEEQLVHEYNAFDIMATTTQGEGFGLTTLESMACGKPNAVPRWSGLGDWTDDAAIQVKCTTFAMAPYGTGAIGGLADKDEMIGAFDLLYSSEQARKDYGQRSLAHARQSRFRWSTIGKQYENALAGVGEPVLA